LFEGLERIVIARRKSAIDHPLRDPRGLARAEIRGLRMARNTRLVATGFLRMKSLLPASMQQKYCDHGRSMALLTITRPILRARSSCGSGGKPGNASIFPAAHSSIGVGEEPVPRAIAVAGSSPTCA